MHLNKLLEQIKRHQSPTEAIDKLATAALLQQQTSNIVSQIRPCPVPAYLTCNPLVNASSEPITGSQVSAGNRYIAYFNKCDNVIQLMNYTPAPAA